MKKILLFIFILLCVLSVSSVYAAKTVHIYFNWVGTVTDDIRIILLGLPDSPVETTFVKVINPKDSTDNQYYQAAYDCMSLPDGDYVLSGKITNKWGNESEVSESFPFFKGVPAGLSGMELGVSED